MEITRVFDLLDWLKENYQKDDILNGKRNGQWTSFSTNDYYKFSVLLSYGLHHLGLRKGDKIDRRTEVVDGAAHWVSKVIRADGGIEVWIRRYVDDDDSYRLTTHVGYALVAHFVSVEPDL